jgi:predicted acylesterase/phospholipase RssA
MDFRQELHNSYQYLISSHSLSIEKKLEFLTNTRQALGKTALCLSGGAAFGLYHVGVIKTLWL